MKTVNVKELNQKFDRVALKHINDSNEHPFGKCTIAVISDGDLRYVGISRCSESDQFSKNKGRKIAIGRALKHISNKDKKSELKLELLSFVFPVDEVPGVVKNLVPEHLYLKKHERNQ